MRRKIAGIQLIGGIVLGVLALILLIYGFVDFSSVVGKGVSSITEAYGNTENPDAVSSIVIEATVIRIGFMVFLGLILVLLALSFILVLDGLKKRWL